MKFIVGRMEDITENIKVSKRQSSQKHSKDSGESKKLTNTPFIGPFGYFHIVNRDHQSSSIILKIIKKRSQNKDQIHA
jgi:hypothetical protein